MSSQLLTRYLVGDVALLGDESRPCGVTFAFTERSGGVSEGAFASLNLDYGRGDEDECVARNRELALAALGLGHLSSRLVTARQVHGARVVRVEGGDAGSIERARAEAGEGADAFVCTAIDVPIMLFSADCALVAIVAPGGFALAHSGWRGTLAQIAGVALEELCQLTGAAPEEARAYVGPHIGRDDYEVSDDLVDRFGEEFGPGVSGPGNTLDLSYAICAALERRGMPRGAIAVSESSTFSEADRFFSYRAQGGICGRNALVACRLSSAGEGAIS